MNKPIAMGAFKFVQLALMEHRKRFHGECAKRVVLSPASFADFMCSHEIHHALTYGKPRDDCGVIFHNTLIVPSEELNTPKLINCRNEVVYL